MHCFFRERTRESGQSLVANARGFLTRDETRERFVLSPAFLFVTKKKKKKKSRLLRVTRTAHQLGHGQVLVAAELLQHVLDVLFVLTGDFHQRFDGREFCFSPHVY